MVKIKVDALEGVASVILKGTKLVAGEIHNLPDDVAAFLHTVPGKFDVLEGEIKPITVVPSTLKAAALKAAKAAQAWPRDPTAPLDVVPQLPPELVKVVLGKDAAAAVKSGTLDAHLPAAAILAHVAGLDELVSVIASRKAPKTEG